MRVRFHPAFRIGAAAVCHQPSAAQPTLRGAETGLAATRSIAESVRLNRLWQSALDF